MTNKTGVGFVESCQETCSAYEHYKWLIRNRLFNGSFVGYLDWCKAMEAK